MADQIITNFTMTEWTLDDHRPTIHFNFHCDTYGSFKESVTFASLSGPLTPALTTSLAAMIDLLHVALGVSYYKCAAAQHVILPSGSEQALHMATALYTEGLAEFFVRAELPFPAQTAFTQQKPQPGNWPIISTLFPHTAEALVAFGGGKDSYVAVNLVEEAGKSWQLCSVVLSQKVEQILQKTAPSEIIFIERTLDPKLRDISLQGAYNGHVPITAINSLALSILGYLTASEYIIFANERSAEEPTLTVNGIPANHQYSKSGAFEELLRAALNAAAPSAPLYFSILRPFSEIWIAECFTKLEHAFPHFTSCNRNFQITGNQSPRWCGECAKCAFTSLITAPHLSPPQADTIFPSRFLDSAALLPFYEELCGLGEKKPWDCVGTLNECRATLYQLGKSPHWSNTVAVQSLLPEVLKNYSPTQLEAWWEEGQEPNSTHAVPELFWPKIVPQNTSLKEPNA